MSDCWRRCLAKVLGIEVEEVPDFVAKDPVYWLANTGQWLHGRGRQLAAMVPVCETEAMDLASLAVPLVTCIMVVQTQSMSCHAVVMEGGAIEWDPAGRHEPHLAILGLYWVI